MKRVAGPASGEYSVEDWEKGDLDRKLFRNTLFVRQNYLKVVFA